MKKEITKDIEEITEEFERNGMIQALKDAEDFNPLQFELMMKLIANELLPTVLQAQRIDCPNDPANQTTPSSKKEYKNPPCGNCHEDHEGRTLCRVDFMTTPNSKWEEEFDKEFEDSNYKGLFEMHEELWRVKNFIRDLLHSRDEELVRKIEGRIKTGGLFSDRYRNGLKDGFNSGLSAAIEIIKKRNN